MKIRVKNPTIPDKIAVVRRYAKSKNMTFKRQLALINGAQAYMLTDRSTRAPIVQNLTVDEAYEGVLNGGLDKYAPGQASLF